MGRIFVKSFGCPSNLYDGEIIESMLTNDGYELINDIKNAEIIVLNICSVKTPSVNSIQKILKNNKSIPFVICGCIMAEDIPGFEQFHDNMSIVSTYNVQMVPQAVKNSLNGKNVNYLTGGDKNKLSIQTSLDNECAVQKTKSCVQIIPVNTGCNNTCTYCSVKIVKGNLKSYDEDLIISRIKKAVNAGSKEIWLTSQDIASYAMDDINNIDFKKRNIVTLVNKILELEGDFIIRLGMMNINNLQPFKEGIAKLLNNDRVFKFIHIPLQSGSDNVLKVMNRSHTVLEYINTINYFKNAVERLTIATDMIVGFPGETDEDAEKSLNVLREIKPDVVNISRFWKRIGTAAAKMKQLQSHVIAGRSRIMTTLFKDISKEKNSNWVGWKGTVLLDENGKNGYIGGRNIYYKPIIIKNIDCLGLGDKIEVLVKNSNTFDLCAEKLHD